MRWPNVQWLALAALIIGIFSGPRGLQAQQPDSITAIVTAPANGQQLFGQVQIIGSAAHPTAFESYTLEYDDLGDPAVQWLLVQPRVQQQVQNNVLGAWNTIMVPDGVYQLRLRVVLTDGQIGEFTVTNLRVINSAPTPLPTAGAALEPGVPTPGPSPTSAIDQPPSNNPAAGITGLDVPTPESVSTGSASETSTATTRINTGRIWRAFCSGVYITLIVFGIMFVYMLLRGRLRPVTQRLMWHIQDELDDR